MKPGRLYKFAIVFCLVGLAEYAYSDESEVWLATKADYALHPQTTISFKQGYRTVPGNTESRKNLSEFKAEFDFSQNGSLFGLYRFSNLIDKNKHRIGFGSSLKTKISMLKCHYRFSYEYESAYGEEGSSRIRNRIRVKMDTDIFVKPAIDLETFHVGTGIGYIYDEYRLTMDIKVKLTSHSNVTLTIKGKWKDPAGENMDHINVLGLGYAYTL